MHWGGSGKGFPVADLVFGRCGWRWQSAGAGAGPVTKFHAQRAPSISVAAYLERCGTLVGVLLSGVRRVLTRFCVCSWVFGRVVAPTKW